MINRHLARITAVIGIPLVVVAVMMLMLVDLNLVRDKHVSRSLLVSSIAAMLVALGFMFYRFARLKI